MWTFDKDKHQFKYNGNPAPSVTQILDDVGLVVGKQYFTEQARERGRAVHYGAWLLLHNTLDWSSVCSEILPHLKAAEDFLNNSKFEPDLSLSEVPRFHEGLGYGGIPDLVGVINGRKVLVDFKSGAIGTATNLQTMGYKLFPALADIQSRFALQLQSNGKYRLVEYANDYDDKADFISAIRIYHAKRRLNAGHYN